MSSSSLSDSLREERQKSFQHFAQASLTQSIPAKEVCEGWSHVADDLLIKTFNECFPGQDITLFALGKLGSFELNLSSDVDLLLVSSEDRAEHLSGLRQFQKLLTERTPKGFVFRVDFDLRPGGRHGPLIPSIDQFKDYYGSYGETWERLALLRLRFLAGSSAIANEVLGFAKKFSFRRHLDFTLFEDLKHLRGKIQNQQAEKPTPDSLHLKLAVGGIRDVELFTHALLVVHGGKDTELQLNSTTAALKLLGKKKLLPEAEADFLLKHYWHLRSLENYVQAADEQTHLLKLTGVHPEWVTKAIPQLAADFKHCEEIVKSLLGDAPQDISVSSISDLGITDEEIQKYWDEILDTEVLSQNKGRDEAARKAFLKEFIVELTAQGGDLKRGLLLLKDFIRNTRAKATFFSLLLREKPLLKKLSWLFGHSPYLAGILCSRPELLDSFVYQAQASSDKSDLAQVLEDLTEKKLLSEILNGSDYLAKKDLPKILERISSTADSICAELLEVLKKEYPSDIQYVALGKWGGHELGFRSDLDFILVTQDEVKDADHKLARRFISRLTESHRGGSIYSIDMRLRPSGKAGPLVIAQSQLEEYLRVEASAWERQAYLKARFMDQSDQSLQTICIEKSVTEAELAELERIRVELAKNKSPLDLKYAEGGLIDIEFASQIYLLFHRLTPKGTSTFDFIAEMGSDAAVLSQNYIRLRQLEQMLQLVASESITNLSPNHESFQFLAKALQSEPDVLINEVTELLQANVRILQRLDPRPRSH